jgi:hypothetical protein
MFDFYRIYKKDKKKINKRKKKEKFVYRKEKYKIDTIKG